MEKLLNLNEIKTQFPNEWVLLGDPLLSENKLAVLAGIPIYHSKDKKEVCYVGRDKTAAYGKITLIYTGALKPTRKITGIFKRINQ